MTVYLHVAPAEVRKTWSSTSIPSFDPHGVQWNFILVFIFGYMTLLFHILNPVVLCGNKMPTRCNRGFYCRSYCLLNMFRAPLCPSSGAQEYYTVVAALATGKRLMKAVKDAVSFVQFVCLSPRSTRVPAGGVPWNFILRYYC